MKRDVSEEASVTIGLDLGDTYSYAFAIDADGVMVEEGRVRTTRAGIMRFLKDRDPCRIALEVGTHSPWVSRFVSDLGHEVLVANARKLRAIYCNELKSDRIDAEMLARIARLDPQLLYPIRHRGAVAQTDLARIRSRAALVRARTLLINHVRGSVKAFGKRLPKCGTRSFSSKAAAHIPEELQAALHPLLSTITELSQQIDRQQRAIVKLAADSYPETASLQQVFGVGPVTALTYVLTLQDPTRFQKSRDVAAYLGLTPRRRQSGDHEPELRISKTGDADLRRLLVQAAQYILGPFGPETALRVWGLTLANRGGKRAKRRAVVAVARKLAVLLHRLWLTGDVYAPAGLPTEQNAEAA